MNLYRWKSQLMAAYAPGYIVAMAETVEEARAKVLSEYRPLEEGGPSEDITLIVMRDYNDDELEERLEARMKTLREDLAAEPEIIPAGVIFLRGSD